MFKKILTGLLLSILIASVSFGASPGIRDTMDNAKIYKGYEFLTMYVNAEEVATSSALVWYADNILGYSGIGINSFAVSSGNVPTTISAQALAPDRTALAVAAQIITAGTDLTPLYSPWYSFTLPADSVTRDVTFIFNIAVILLHILN